MPVHLTRMVLAATLAASSALPTRQGTPPLVGVYGTLQYIEEAGDVVGVEIIISQVGAEYRVSYQRAEGAPGPVYRVVGLIHGDSVSFQLPPDTLINVVGRTRQILLVPHPRFRGRITASELRGGFDGGPIEELPRLAHSYWTPS